MTRERRLSHFTLEAFFPRGSGRRTPESIVTHVFRKPEARNEAAFKRS